MSVAGPIGDTEASLAATGEHVADAVEPDRVPAETAPAQEKAIGPRWKFRLVGGLVVLLAVAAGLAISSWGRGNHPDRNIVAAYDGGTITREALLERWRTATPAQRVAMLSPEGLALMIQSQAVHAVTERWARERRLDAREMFARAMREATQEIGIHDVEKRFHESEVRVGEGEIQQYFEANRERFKDRTLTQVRDEIRSVLHAGKEEAAARAFLKQLRDGATITVEAELLRVPEPSREEITTSYLADRDRFVEPDRVRIEEIQIDATGNADDARTRAEKARARLQAGEDLEAVAAAVGGWASRRDGFEARGSRGPTFDGNVLSLTQGDLSPAFRDGNSYFVVRVLERRRERRRSLEEVEGEIRSILRAERERQRYAENKSRTLVMVNGQRYTLGDFLTEAESIAPKHQHDFGGFEGKLKLLDRLVDRLLILQTASGRMADLRSKTDIEETRRHILAEMLHQEEMAAEKEPTEEDLKRSFQKEPSRYQPPLRLKLSLIEVRRGDTEEADRRAWAKAQAAQKRVRPARLLFWRRGEDFATVAREVSEDRDLAQKGGETDGWFTHPAGALMDLESHAAMTEILSVRAGGVSGVIPLGDRYYIVKVRERQELPPLPFDRVKDEVRADLRRERHREVLARMERELVKRLNLVIHEDRIGELLAEMGALERSGRR